MLNGSVTPVATGDAELVEVERLAGVGGVAADARQQVGAPLPDARIGGADVELGDGGVHALASAERDRLEERERALRHDRLLRRGGSDGEHQREHDGREAGRRAAHGARLSAAPRDAPARRGGTGR